MGAEHAGIAIDLRLEGEQISGWAGDGLGEPESFSGWVGLIGALDRLLERARGEDSFVKSEREGSL